MTRAVVIGGMLFIRVKLYLQEDTIFCFSWEGAGLGAGVVL